MSERVIRVGHGRGFVMDAGRFGRVVVTAAHCIPELPPAATFSLTEDRTYPSLLARLGQEPSICCECVFVDPVSDIAVLAGPDNQQLSEEWEAYEEFVEDVEPLALHPLRAVSTQPLVGEVLGLGGEWLTVNLQPTPRGLWLSDCHG